jgi:hypothetical protein
VEELAREVEDDDARPLDVVGNIFFFFLICLMICFFLVISVQVFFFFCLLDWRSAQNFSQPSVEMVRTRDVKTTTTPLSAGSLLSLSPKGGSGNWAKALTLDAAFTLGFGSKLRRNDCGFFSAFWVFYFAFLPIEVDFCFMIRHSNPLLPCVIINFVEFLTS